MTRVLFVNNPARQCGVYNHGLTTAEALRESTRLRVSYLEMPEDTRPETFLELLAQNTPDVIIYNWHYLTMTWVNNDLLAQVRRKFFSIQHLALAHDEPPPFRLLSAVIQIDPTAPESEREFRVRRLVPEYLPTQQPPDNVIGWFGFATKHKGVLRVIEQVNAEFDDAVVRLHIPFNSYIDREGVLALQLAEQCRQLAKPGIRVETSHDYKTAEQLIEWLSGNSVNCYLYDAFPATAISSAVDYALAARRPIAVSDCNMFRHILKLCPGVRLAGRSLKAIIAEGFAPLEPIRQDWSATHLKEDYEGIVETVVRNALPSGFRSNRVIASFDQEALRPAVEELRALEPETVARKLPMLLHRNAFIFRQVADAAREGDDVLLIGGNEDPTGCALAKLGCRVRVTDPTIDGLEVRPLWLESLQKTGRRYDVIASASVMEHVLDDVSFVYHIYALLKPGGTAFLTASFQERPTSDDRTPQVDAVPRQYTAERLRNIAKHLPETALLDAPIWSECDPGLAGMEGSFCSLAFRKSTERPAFERIVEDRLESLVRAMAAENEIVERAEHELESLVQAKNEVIAGLEAELTTQVELRIRAELRAENEARARVELQAENAALSRSLTNRIHRLVKRRFVRKG